MRKIFDLINSNLFYSKLKQSLSESKNLGRPHIITISRETGSGGRTIAHLLVEKLGAPWKVYHEEILSEIAKKTHLEKELISEVNEQRLPFIEQIMMDFFGKKYLNLNAYHKQLTRILSVIGQRGDAIIIGRGASFLLPSSLKVRIICEMNKRVERLMKLRNLSRNEAIKLINESDKKRSSLIKALYNHDVKKAHHYDLVIRIDNNLTIEDAVEIILAAAKQRFK